MVIADFSITRRTISNNRELFDELVRLFMEDSPTLLQGIMDGIANENTEVIRRNAHTLKSQFGIFAAEKSRELAERVEFSVGTIQCKQHAEELKAALAELHSTIVSYVW